jgi:hypothetical protein
MYEPGLIELNWLVFCHRNRVKLLMKGPAVGTPEFPVVHEG